MRILTVHIDRISRSAFPKGCHCVKVFVNFDAKIFINSTAAKSVNKIPILITENAVFARLFSMFRG